jgi:SHS2 domain-containing protein
MAGEWTTFEHTADIGLRARADSLAELLAAMGDGLARQVCESGVRPAEVRRVEVAADDPPDLLHDFLAEVLGLFERERFLAAEVNVVRAGAGSAAATVRGELYDGGRHELGPEVKAVTYHELTAEQTEDGWLGRVVLDI